MHITPVHMLLNSRACPNKFVATTPIFPIGEYINPSFVASYLRQILSMDLNDWIAD